MKKKPTVFISYAHEDEKAKDALSVQLAALQAEDENFLDSWDDRRIGAGEDWKEKIEQAMDRASVAVLLVSAYFLTSKFILREEVPRLLARREKGLRIVPIIVRPCNWQRVKWLSEKMQVRPKDGRPLMSGSEAEIEADCSDITNEIATILDAIATEPEPVAVAPQPELLTQPPPQPLPAEPPAVTTAESVAAPASTPAVATTAIARDAKKADAAVRVVTNLAAMSDITDLCENFCRDLRAASEAIVGITTYKELHDELHSFEGEGFADILNEYPRIDKDPRARENLSSRAMMLLGTINLTRALAKRLSSPAREIQWIERLEQAHKHLLDAIAAQNVSRATAGVGLLRRVLDMELPRLNEVMVSQAGTLDISVAPIKNALEFVHAHAADLKIEPASERKVREGIEAFERLISGFMALIADHNVWQNIEDELRIVETGLASSLDQLEILWPGLRQKLDPTLNGKRDAWATKLQASLTALQSALDLRDPQRAPEIRALFERFRSGCGKHFLSVDDHLREECGKLANVDESLQLLLRMIDTQQTS